jgi:uncharacterized membrane protein
MAGIGFELRKLARQDTISSLVAAGGHAAVIAAGPWLFTIASLAAITVLTERLQGLATLASFRVIVIYAFALSLVMSAPVAIIATRLVADALWLKQPERMRPLLMGAYALAVLVMMATNILVLAVFRLPVPLALALSAMSMMVALIWIALAFCGAVRDYLGVTLAFLIGLIVSLVASVLAAVFDLGAAGMAAGFLLGLTVTFLGLTLRVLRTFPQPMSEPFSGIREIVRGLGTYWPIALGAFAGTLGVWIDKWIFWASSVGERIDGGLLHAPLYDSAMFIASLTIIPSLAAFVMRLETGFFERYQRYYATINSHGTYGQIEQARQYLVSYTLDTLTLIIIAQAGLSALLVLTAPLIIDLLNLQFRQIAILRYGALGAALQFVFIAYTSILLFFDRRWIYLAMQVMLLVLTTSLTIASAELGEEYYGTGYFLACLISALVAFVVAERTLANLNYLTFIGNNPSIKPATHKPATAAGSKV